MASACPNAWLGKCLVDNGHMMIIILINTLEDNNNKVIFTPHVDDLASISLFISHMVITADENN